MKGINEITKTPLTAKVCMFDEGVDVIRKQGLTRPEGNACNDRIHRMEQG